MARDVFDLDDLWRSIDALDNLVADEVQARMFVEVVRLLERSTLWFLRHLQAGGARDVTRRCSRAAARRRSGSRRSGPRCCPRRSRSAGTSGGASWRMRAWIANSRRASRAARSRRRVLDIAEVASNCERSLELVASVYFALGTLLNYGWIAERAMALPAPTHWDMLARAAALAELARLKRALTVSALANASTTASIAGCDRRKLARQARRRARTLCAAAGRTARDRRREPVDAAGGRARDGGARKGLATRGASAQQVAAADERAVRTTPALDACCPACP